MFTKAKNIDTAFRHTRVLALVVIASCVIIAGIVVFKSFSMVLAMQQKVYVLANGKAIEAFSSERKDNLPVEARDHVKTFHQLFFNLDPDDKVINENIGRALYLADISAKREYDDLKEKSYYANIISGNVIQRIRIDSVLVDLNNHPYRFRCVAKLEITRSTSSVDRSLITEGYLRNVNRSDNNAHGFLIEGWRVIENKDKNVTQNDQGKNW